MSTGSMPPPLPRREAPPAIGPPAASLAALTDGHRVFFEGGFTPNVQLLPGEEVVDVFEAGVLDLGLLASLFNYKARMVLTTHRLFNFRKKIIDNNLQIVWLKAVRSVAVGQAIRGWMVAIGLFLIIFGWVYPSWDGRPVYNSYSLWRSSPLAALTTFLSFLVIGVLFVLLARVKKMVVRAGDQEIGLRLIRLRPEESERFINKVFAGIARRDAD